MKQQPARVNYFFKDAYRELGRTIRNTFSRCGDKISDAWISFKHAFSDLFEDIGDMLAMLGDEFEFGPIFRAFWHALVLGFFTGKLVFTALLTPIFCIVFSCLQIIMVVVMMTFVYVGYMIFAFADGVYCQLKKVSTSCPKCQDKYALPTYVCQCGAHHTKLVPSKYGILTRECECGRKLRTTFFNGRHKLPGKWVCPTCGYELGSPLQMDILIPVVGGPSSGKTCYISTVISQLSNSAESKYNLNFQYKENAALGDDYFENAEHITNGRLPQKTNDTRLRYYQFFLTPKGEKVKNLISICDVAGETYEHASEIGSQVGFKNAQAFLMILDPLSVPHYREEVEKKIDLRHYGASERPMEEVVDALIHILENMKCIDSKHAIDANVAVVFAKCDIPGLEKIIGETAVAKYMRDNEGVTWYEAQNRVCEDFLIEHEEENLLNTLKSKFTNIQFFTCSALGHVEDGTAFNPNGVEEPALWLINKINSNIHIKEKVVSVAVSENEDEMKDTEEEVDRTEDELDVAEDALDVVEGEVDTTEDEVATTEDAE